MKDNISKAQLEVWEWKEKASLKLSTIPECKRIAVIKEDVKASREWIMSKRKKNKLSIK